MQAVGYAKLRDEIIEILAEMELGSGANLRMLDYAIELFESRGLGVDYYGYHNINHELEVTFVTLLAASWKNKENIIVHDDIKHLFAAALFHDFDPEKSVDKPHEENVVKFVSRDADLRRLFGEAGIDADIVEALILRTTYPWRGSSKAVAEMRITQCLKRSETVGGSKDAMGHIEYLGRFLSVADRMAGYSMGGFSRGMQLAKMNAHALGWHPSLLVQRAVGYFEDLLNGDPGMTQRVLRSVPKQMRRNLMSNVLSFMRLRQKEIQVQADYLYDNLEMIPVIEKMRLRNNEDFIDALYAIYCELPEPLRFGEETFRDSIKDPDILLNTLRLHSPRGEIIGFAKGGRLERYRLNPAINDENYGRENTAFLEPLALKMGYWGMHGGREMRSLFTMQAHSKKFRYMTSFALRDVIERRVRGLEKAEFVMRFDPERWDYYRIPL